MTKVKHRRNMSARRTMQVEHLSAWTRLSCDAILEMALAALVQPPPEGRMSIVESSLRRVVTARLDEVTREIRAWVLAPGRTLGPPDQSMSNVPIWDSQFIRGLFDPLLDQVRWVGDDLVARIGFTLVVGSLCCGELANHTCIADVRLLPIGDEAAEAGSFEVIPGSFHVASTAVLPVAHPGAELDPLEVALDCCNAW